MQTPLFKLYSKFWCGRQKNPKIEILRDVAEKYILKFSIKTPSSFLL